MALTYSSTRRPIIRSHHVRVSCANLAGIATKRDWFFFQVEIFAKVFQVRGLGQPLIHFRRVNFDLTVNVALTLGKPFTGYVTSFVPGRLYVRRSHGPWHVRIETLPLTLIVGSLADRQN